MSRDSSRTEGRREFIAGTVAAWLGVGCDPHPSTTAPGEKVMTSREAESTPQRQPVVFIGHGSPMNAIEDNRWSQGFRELGQALPKPRAVLSVSAHWFTPGSFITDNARPETIHDFGGFPQALFDVRYPAPGQPDLAVRVRDLLAAHSASLRSDWGLDHGTWSVLVHLLPAADVPVLQLSIDARLPPARHIEIGKALAPLREEGVLILGSGNITHNLRDAFTNMRSGRTATSTWAADFDRGIADALGNRDSKHLATALETANGRNAHPTPDHYLPLLYTFGASSPSDTLQFPIEGFDLGSLSMRSVRFG